MAKKRRRPTVPEAHLGLRERQRRHRRRDLLEAAESSFRDRGFEDTTIAYIAEQAMVSPATVFNYFGSKEAILLTLLTREHEQWLEKVEVDRRVHEGAAVDRLTGFFVSLAESALAYLDRQSWRHVEAAGIKQPDSDFVRQYNDKVVASIYRKLRATIELIVAEKLAPGALAEPAIVLMVFNHWYREFQRLITAETLEVPELERDLRAALATLLGALDSSP